MMKKNGREKDRKGKERKEGHGKNNRCKHDAIRYSSCSIHTLLMTSLSIPSHIPSHSFYAIPSALAVYIGLDLQRSYSSSVPPSFSLSTTLMHILFHLSTT